jgi:excisionase family DNA binding protein
MDATTKTNAPADALLLTTGQAASRLAVCRRTLYSLAAAGKIKLVHIGRACRVRADELQRFVDSM